MPADRASRWRRCSRRCSASIATQQGLLLLFGCLPPAVLNFMVAEQYQQEPGKVASIVLIGNVLAIAVRSARPRARAALTNAAMNLHRMLQARAA